MESKELQMKGSLYYLQEKYWYFPFHHRVVFLMLPVMFSYPIPFPGFKPIMKWMTYVSGRRQKCSKKRRERRKGTWQPDSRGRWERLPLLLLSLRGRDIFFIISSSWISIMFVFRWATVTCGIIIRKQRTKMEKTRDRWLTRGLANWWAFYFHCFCYLWLASPF